MEPALFVALLGATITVIGWMINHVLAVHRERRRQQAEALRKYVERQLEELYGPLAFLLYEGNRAFLDLLDSLGRRYVFIKGQPLSQEDLKTWLFWIEHSFLPRNHKIKELLVSKTHLIEGSKFPESYVAFLDHHNSWAINHARWKKEDVPYSWHSKINWPQAFGENVLSTFQLLKQKHAELLGRLAREE